MAQRKIPALGQVGNEIVDQTLPQFGVDDQDGSDDSETAPSSLDALHSLLTNGAQFTPPPAVTGGNRNPAVTGALMSKYGLGPDKGAISQEDLQALDSFVRGADVRDAISKAVAPIDEKGGFDTQIEQDKNQNALDVENLKGKYGLENTALANQGKIGAVEAKGGGQPTIDPAFTASQVQNMGTLSLLDKLSPVDKAATINELQKRGVDMQNLTNQTETMREASNEALKVLDLVNAQADGLNKTGDFGYIASPLRRGLTFAGATSLAPMFGLNEGGMSQFESSLQGLQSLLKKSLYGARGGTQLQPIMDKMIAAKGDYQTFQGQAQAMRDMLHVLAEGPGATAPTSPAASAPASDPWATPPTAAELGR